jgi:hypothetical protein
MIIICQIKTTDRLQGIDPKPYATTLAAEHVNREKYPCTILLYWMVKRYPFNYGLS